MGVLQIDSISVVARSPYLVLWSRLGAYEPGWLDAPPAEGGPLGERAHGRARAPPAASRGLGGGGGGARAGRGGGAAEGGGLLGVRGPGGVLHPRGGLRALS